MSQPAVVVPFEADPALVLVQTRLPQGPALYVGAPVAPGWAAWAARLDGVLSASCRSLVRKGRVARRITVTLTYADGRRRRRTLALARPTDEARDLMPAALGLLRLLVDERPGVACKLAVHLGQLSRRDVKAGKADKPLVFRRRPGGQRRVRHAWMRAAAAVALLVGSPFLLPLR